MSDTPSPSAAPLGPFHVGPWHVFPKRLCIRHGSREETLTPKVMDALVYLAHRSGEVVTKDELLEAVWPGVYVSDGAIRRTISHLRQALGDDPRAPRYIKTISKTGYRLIASVRPAAVEDAGGWAPEPFARRITRPPPRWVRLGMAGMLLLAAALSLWWVVRPALPGTAPLRVVPITTFHGDEVAPSLSPDGKQVAFTRVQPLPGGDFRGDLFVKLVDTEALLQLTDDAAFETAATWSPDGHHLAYVGQHQDQCGLFSVAAIGGAVRRLASCSAAPSDVPPTLSWSPDGSRLAFVRPDAETGRRSIYTLNLGLHLEEQQTVPPPQHHDHDPAFAPDGTALAFVRSQPDGAAAILSQPLTTGGEPRTLYTHPTAVWGLHWSETALYFFSDGPDQRVALWAVARHGGLRKRIALPPEAHHGGDFAVQGDRLVFAATQIEADLWHVAPGADEPTRSPASSTRLDLMPQLSPDGSRLAFFSDRRGHVGLWVSRLDGPGLLELTTAEGTDFTAPAWSPDGSRVAFASSHGVFIVPVTAGPVQRIETMPRPIRTLAFGPDGDYLYATIDAETGPRIWQIPTNPGAPSPLIGPGTEAWLRWVDETHVYFTSADSTGLYRSPLEGGTAEAVSAARLGSLSQAPVWAATDQGVYVLSDERPATIQFVDFATQQRREILRLDHGRPRHLSASADGQTLIYDLERLRGIDLMMIEGLDRSF